MSVVEIREPDEMGVWAEDAETVWLPRSRYPNHIDAIRWAMAEWEVGLPEVRCLARWMCYAPLVVGVGCWREDNWWECDPAEPGAFRVWRLESA